MRRETKLYSVREVKGLATVEETPRLYDFQAREKVGEIATRLGASHPVGIAVASVKGAAESGASRINIDGTHGVLVLAATP